jgi:uncharacterized protein (TIGR00369 family)
MIASLNLLSELQPGLDGLGQLRAMLVIGRQPSIHKLLNIALISAESGFVTVVASPGEEHLNPAGTVHGGYIATVLDTACGCAGHSALPAYTAYTTLELKISYHRPVTAQSGKIRAEGRLLSIGKRAAFTEAKLTDAAGKLLASATSTLILTSLAAAPAAKES